MKPEPEEFERLLKRQTFRPLPREWRAEMVRLAGAEARRASAGVVGDRPVSRGVTAVALWGRCLLWPSPRAWAGLAAIWVMLLVCNGLTRDPAPPSGTIVRSTLADTVLLTEQRRLRAELFGDRISRAADESDSPTGQPRSAVMSRRTEA